MRAILLAAALALTALSGPVMAAKINELNRIVAVVDDDVITALELDERIQLVTRQLQAKQTAAPSAEQLRRQVLDRLILERLQLAEAKGRGIRVDDETVNQVLTAIATENQLSLEQFREVLARDGMDFPRFRESVRDEVTIARLRNAVIDSKVTVAPQEVNQLLESAQPQDNEYHLLHILITVREAASPTEVQEAAAKAKQVVAELRGGADFGQMAVAYSGDDHSLQGGDLGWRKSGQLPTAFVKVVQSMQPGEIADPIRSSSGFHILKLADKREQAARTVVQTHARHILIKSGDEDDGEAKVRIERLAQRLDAGEDFAELARSNSEDPGSAVKGGDLGWANPGDFVPAFQEAVDKLDPGQRSAPFKSQVGWHIVELIQRRRQQDASEQQRAQAQELLRQRKIDEQTETWLRQLRDEAYVEYRLEG